MKNKHVIRCFILALAFMPVAAWGRAQASVSARPAPDERTLGAEEVLEAERLLQGLGYWTGPVDGDMDEGSRQALIAFQKVERRQRSGRLTPSVLNVLRNAQRPSLRFKNGFHVEVDLRRQVLFVVDEDDRVKLVLPVSTGDGKLFTEGGWTRYAKTPRGRFRVYKKIDEWRKTPLGLLYYPSYIIGGVAIHGSHVVPTHPATHGCIAVPMHAAEQLSLMMPVGTEVIIYGRP